MAKTSAVQRNLKRIKLAERYSKKRAALRKIIKNKLLFQEKINKTIMEVFFSILTEIELNWLKKFDKICDFIGNIDVNFSKAYFSKKYN